MDEEKLAEYIKSDKGLGQATNSLIIIDDVPEVRVGLTRLP